MADESRNVIGDATREAARDRVHGALFALNTLSEERAGPATAQAWLRDTAAEFKDSVAELSGSESRVLQRRTGARLALGLVAAGHDIPPLRRKFSALAQRVDTVRSLTDVALVWQPKRIKENNLPINLPVHLAFDHLTLDPPPPAEVALSLAHEAPHLEHRLSLAGMAAENAQNETIRGDAKRLVAQTCVSLAGQEDNPEKRIALLDRAVENAQDDSTRGNAKQSVAEICLLFAAQSPDPWQRIRLAERAVANAQNDATVKIARRMVAGLYLSLARQIPDPALQQTLAAAAMRNAQDVATRNSARALVENVLPGFSQPMRRADAAISVVVNGRVDNNVASPLLREAREIGNLFQQTRANMLSGFFSETGNREFFDHALSLRATNDDVRARAYLGRSLTQEGEAAIADAREVLNLNTHDQVKLLAHCRLYQLGCGDGHAQQARWLAQRYPTYLTGVPVHLVTRRFAHLRLTDVVAGVVQA